MSSNMNPSAREFVPLIFSDLPKGNASSSSNRYSLAQQLDHQQQAQQIQREWALVEGQVRLKQGKQSQGPRKLGRSTAGTWKPHLGEEGHSTGQVSRTGKPHSGEEGRSTAQFPRTWKPHSGEEGRSTGQVPRTGKPHSGGEGHSTGQVSRTWKPHRGEEGRSTGRSTGQVPRTWKPHRSGGGRPTGQVPRTWTPQWSEDSGWQYSSSYPYQYTQGISDQRRNEENAVWCQKEGRSTGQVPRTWTPQWGEDSGWQYSFSYPYQYAQGIADQRGNEESAVWWQKEGRPIGQVPRTWTPQLGEDSGWQYSSSYPYQYPQGIADQRRNGGNAVWWQKEVPRTWKPHRGEVGRSTGQVPRTWIPQWDEDSGWQYSSSYPYQHAQVIADQRRNEKNAVWWQKEGRSTGQVPRTWKPHRGEEGRSTGQLPKIWIPQWGEDSGWQYSYSYPYQYAQGIADQRRDEENAVWWQNYQPSPAEECKAREVDAVWHKYGAILNHERAFDGGYYGEYIAGEKLRCFEVEQKALQMGLDEGRRAAYQLSESGFLLSSFPLSFVSFAGAMLVTDYESDWLLGLSRYHNCRAKSKNQRNCHDKIAAQGLLESDEILYQVPQLALDCRLYPLRSVLNWEVQGFPESLWDLEMLSGIFSPPLPPSSPSYPFFFGIEFPSSWRGSICVMDESWDCILC